MFNLLEQAVVNQHGPDAWERLIDEAGVEGAYTAVGTYPHEELHGLVSAASSLLSTPVDDLVRWFGRTAIPLLVERYPVFFEKHSTTKDFALTLNDVIHPEVRKLFPGAYAPEFDFDDTGPDSLALGYKSYRDLCFFAEGLMEGAAAHYGEDVRITQSSCTRNGDEKCVLQCTFLKRDS